MDEVRRQWEEMRLLLSEVQRMSEQLGVTLAALRPSTELPWSDPARVEWRQFWDRYCDLDYDLWQAFCHMFQSPFAE